MSIFTWNPTKKFEGFRGSLFPDLIVCIIRSKSNRKLNLVMRMKSCLFSLFLLCLYPVAANSQNCQANFQTVAVNCSTYNFFDASVAAGAVINSWFWDFGDGNSSTLQNPGHTYASNGNYNVCLTITAGACSSTFCSTVKVNCLTTSLCQAAFSWAWSPNGCPAANFTSNSTSSSGTVSAFSWNFGDGGTSSLQNPSHTYSTNGTYSVCLSITTTTGCTSTYCDTVSVSCLASPCLAAFSWGFGPNGCPSVAFKDMSTSTAGSIISWAWDFGDGGSAATQNPGHTYSSNGSFVVCLSIATANNCTGKFCDTVKITCLSTAVCSAFFQWTFGPNGCPSINATDASTAIPGTVIAWNYDFGDGGTSALQNPGHVYAANGNYALCLTITTSDSCSDTFCDTVAISCISTSSCIADFGWEFTPNGCPAVAFSDSSSANPGTIVSWAWDFGDGGTSSTQNTGHTYTADGNYQVCLYIMTSDSCTDQFCDSVLIDCLTSMAGMEGGISDLHIYPNPTSEIAHVTFTLPRNSVISWEIHSMEGKLLKSERSLHLSAGRQEIAISLEKYPSGWYLIELRSAGVPVHIRAIRE